MEKSERTVFVQLHEYDTKFFGAQNRPIMKEKFVIRRDLIIAVEHIAGAPARMDGKLPCRVIFNGGYRAAHVFESYDEVLSLLGAKFEEIDEETLKAMPAAEEAAAA